MASFISPDLYEQIIENIPIPCVDFVILHEGKVLLTLRTQEPEKDKWWVQGGRIFKNESLLEALQRLAHREVGCKVKILKNLGAYEYFSKASVFSGVKSGTHCLVACFLVEPVLDSAEKLKEEKSARKSFSPIMAFSPVLDKTHSQAKWISRIEEDLDPYVKQLIENAGVFDNKPE